MNSPYRKKPNGIGSMTSATSPRSVFPHPSPKALYNDGPASGRKAPKRDLAQVGAATAEAAWKGKLSTIYVWHVRKRPDIPMPNGSRLTTARIQCDFLSVTQPYQIKPIGMHIA